MKTVEKVKAELNKISNQIEELQQKKKVLEKQKKDMEDMQILSAVKKLGITPENLHLLNCLKEKEVNSYLSQKEPEPTSASVPAGFNSLGVQEEKREKIS